MLKKGKQMKGTLKHLNRNILQPMVFCEEKYDVRYFGIENNIFPDPKTYWHKTPKLGAITCVI